MASVPKTLIVQKIRGNYYLRTPEGKFVHAKKDSIILVDRAELTPTILDAEKFNTLRKLEAAIIGVLIVAGVPLKDILEIKFAWPKLPR